MTNQDNQSLVEQVAALSQRVSYLEAKRGEREKMVSGLSPVVKFLAVFLSVTALCLALANAFMRGAHTLTAVSLQSMMLTCLFTSLILSLLLLVLKSDAKSGTDRSVATAQTES